MTTQCPFATDIGLEDHHLKELETLARLCQGDPAVVRMSNAITDHPLASFISYVDYSAPQDRVSRHCSMALDVSTLQTIHIIL